jgi:threonylcarbamoyladenosine tRNA methylthiotransferase MtaB
MDIAPVVTTMKFHVATLGCKVNAAESEMLIKALESAGWTSTLEGDDADLCVVNTCTVTGKASMQSRQVIRQLRRRYPTARIVATGCYAETHPEIVTAIDGVSAVVGSADKQRLAGILSDLPQALGALGPGALEQKPLEPLPPPVPNAAGNRSRPLLKVQDGCNQYCTYCIVPRARGRSRSLPPKAVMDALRDFASAGYREVVLTGIHLGAYGEDLSPRETLLGLLAAISSETPIERVRLSSIEPNELSRELIETVTRSKIFCPHFHLPLQSGDNGILKQMGRPYGRERFREQVAAIKSAEPNAAIGSDVLVGFPGETREAFDATVSLIDELPLTYLHVFPFSPRKGTPAFHYPDHVPTAVIKERCRILRRMGDDKRRRFIKDQAGKPLHVLIERRRDRRTGLLKGMSSNYLTVLVNGGDASRHRILQLIPRLSEDGRGLIAEAEPAGETDGWRTGDGEAKGALSDGRSTN